MLSSSRDKKNEGAYFSCGGEGREEGPLCDPRSELLRGREGESSAHMYVVTGVTEKQKQKHRLPPIEDCHVYSISCIRTHMVKYSIYLPFEWQSVELVITKCNGIHGLRVLSLHA